MKAQKIVKGAGVSGFSLVELMVVVGIIGVLSTIAIPQYSKFTARTKQTEAKVQLGAIYTVEKAFQVESGSYTACLNGIGYGVEGTQRRYAVGFNNNAITSVGSLVCNSTAIADNVTFFSSAASFAMNNGNLPATSVATAAFTAGAAGNIGTGKVDQWTITDAQTITNTTSGL